MNRKAFTLMIFLLFSGFHCFSQEYYWIEFTDKNNSPYSLSHPEEYLSQRSIERRIRQNIPIDELDLPVNPQYINQVVRPGVNLMFCSKWLNGITVQVFSTGQMFEIEQLSFVKRIELSKPSLVKKSGINKLNEHINAVLIEESDTSYYGSSFPQVNLLNGLYLHNQNYRGQGMVIAILDAGFSSMNERTNQIWDIKLPALDSVFINKQILGSKDFVNPKSDGLGWHEHGTEVLSCIGGNAPHILIGTAPKASFWLLRTEEAITEYIIEEDRYISAAEFADSVGADIINSSLGYFEFDDSRMNHKYSDMDGKTTRVTRAANIAVNKGMLIFSGAGNEGENEWKYIIAPADGDNVIGVGAVDEVGNSMSWSSYGPASDNEVKPNVVAQGWPTIVQTPGGNIYGMGGTSFASPLMAGMGACLWQANPNATSFEIKDAIERSADHYLNPNDRVGYGIPDMKKADEILKNGITKSISYKVKEQFKVYPNPFTKMLCIENLNPNKKEEMEIEFYSIDGKLLYKKPGYLINQLFLNELGSIPNGLVICKIRNKNNIESFILEKF